MGQVSEMAITWNHYTWPQDLPLDMAKLRAVEKAWGITFPQDYVDCVRDNQGKTPEPASFEFGDGFETSLNDLYHFEPSPSGSNIVENQKRMQMGDVPERIFVFAGDPAGNRICFDYRQSNSAPKVVILDYEVDPEHALVPVADSFTELIAKMR